MLRGVVDEAEIAFASAKSISRVHCSRVCVEVSRTFCRNGSVTIVLVMVTLLPLLFRSWSTKVVVGSSLRSSEDFHMQIIRKRLMSILPPVHYHLFRGNFLPE